MPIQTKKDWISGSSPRKWHHTDGSSQNQRSSRLATPTMCSRCQSLPRFHRILPILHPKPFEACQTTNWPNKESDPIPLGWTLSQSVRTSQIISMFETNPETTRLHQTIPTKHRCVSIRHGSRTLIEGQNQPLNPQTNSITHSLLLSHVQLSWTKLWHLWERITGSN